MSGVLQAVSAHSCKCWEPVKYMYKKSLQLPSLMQQALSWHQQQRLQWQAGSLHRQQISQQQHCYASTVDAAALANKRLGDILKLELIQDKTPDEVEHIWLNHYEASTSHVATVMSKDEHAIVSARAAASPLFVLPIHKPPTGFCTLLIQWQPKQALVTTLDEYKRQGANAPPHFTMNLYRETAETHGLVLVRGDVLSPQLVSLAEGRTIMELVRVFYTDPQAHQLVYAFNHQPNKFDFKHLLRELGMSSDSVSH